MSESCKTKYPLVLIHGAGFRDLKWPVYWGRIPAALEAQGAKIYYSTANAVVKHFEGDNDGLVSASSASWGENFTILRSNSFRGISHLDAIDLRRHRLTSKEGAGISDICDFYVALVKDLKNQGF